ncbi:hypothetical protein EOE67_13725 [Rheinheimera riviphila]|uniref:Uncharacterized protein n=1 Tax=Rheinheimera riviphila TaxID=1834037 RepID=A0A437QLN7_9GAMM|nr:hypothetical protein [Rheinheimera riviphila]RVU35431.1 hypothetical protein EOE67_13725 [Rheinheimera riviphila]
MNNISKGVLATVCLTGNFTIERIDIELNPDDSLASINHQFGFGLTRAFADPSQDGDARLECMDQADTDYQDCMALANGFIDTVISYFQCSSARSDAYRKCDRL